MEQSHRSICTDVTPDLLGAAERAAAADGLASRVRCVVGDINAIRLEANSYDLITFVSALHHVDRLEHVLTECRSALRPGGLFYAKEYVGPSRFAFPPEHAELARTIYRSLDPRLRCPFPELPAPDPKAVEAADPTESVRSDEILRIVTRVFPHVQVFSHDVCLTVILWYGLNHEALYETTDGQALVQWLLDVDRALVRSGRLPSYYVDLIADDRLQRGSGELPASVETSRSSALIPDRTTARTVLFPRFESPRASILIVAWKQRDHLLACLRALRQRLGTDIPYEVILVFNGPPEVEDSVREVVEGATFLRSAVNLGFAGGCNLAARTAKGEYLVLLNDDAVIEPGWLERLVAAADADPGAGAVSSCVLFPDGQVQEAGSIIWRDGSTMPIGRGEPGDSLGWHFVRKVDYGSACSLLVRRATWEKVAGMDTGYHPAYYEDVDLCLAIRAQGQHVLFEPRSRVRHHESASSDPDFKSFLFRRNQGRLKEKWADLLALQEEAAPWSPASVARAVWRARGCPRRILVVDDRVPNPAQGSGYGRMFDALLELSSQGYALALYPSTGATSPSEPLVNAGVAIIDEDFVRHLARPETSYDAVLISRPHNYSRWSPTIRYYQPQAAVVYDCEALFWRRMARQAQLDGATGQSLTSEHVNQMRQLEERIVVEADLLVSVSEEEAEILSKVEGHCPIETILPAEANVRFTSRPFAERGDVGFVAGWMAGPTSPNAHGLRWFASEVLPRIKAIHPWVRVRVTGGGVPAEVRELANPNLVFEGQVADLCGFYDRIRVAISPVRFGAGVKVKTVQALQHGVPVVSTTVGAEGIHLRGLAAIDVTDDPDVFAMMLLNLLTNSSAWNERRAKIADLVSEWRKGPSGIPWTEIMTKVWTRSRRGHSLLV